MCKICTMLWIFRYNGSFERASTSDIVDFKWEAELENLVTSIFGTIFRLLVAFNSMTRRYKWVGFFFQLRTVMEVSSDLKNLNDSLHQRRDLINCLVRHLEDALAIRHFRRQRRGKKTRATDQRHYGKGWSQLNTAGSKADERRETSGRRFSTPVVPLAFSKQARVPGPRPCMPTSSAYLSGLYLAVKILYLANSTTQLGLTGKYVSLNSYSLLLSLPRIKMSI